MENVTNYGLTLGELAEQYKMSHVSQKDAAILSRGVGILGDFAKNRGYQPLDADARADLE
jgi:hypothetical protein